MLSINQIVSLIEDQLASSALLTNGSFLFGDPWEYGASNQITYPLLGCRLIGTSINGKTHTTNLNLFLADLVNKDESNETEVLSDMQVAGLRVISVLRKYLEDNYPATISETSGFTPFTERFDDEVSGVEINITIDQFFDDSTCDAPAGYGKVTIVDSDGNVLTYLNIGATYTVTQLTTLLQDLSDTPPTTIIQDLG